MASTLIGRLFTDHPRTAGLTYFGHLCFAWRFGASMFAGALAAFLHGVLPAVLPTTASRTVRELYMRLENREPASAGSPAVHARR